MEMGKIREGGWPSLMVFGRSGVDRFFGQGSVDEGDLRRARATGEHVL